MLTVTPVSANEKVFLTGEVTPLSVPLYLFEGDSVHVQINIAATEEYRDLSLRVQSGGAFAHPQWRRVGLVPAALDAQPGYDDYYTLREDHLYPDVLENFDPRHIHGHAGHNQTFYLTLSDSPTLSAGEHMVTVRVCEGRRIVSRCGFRVIKIPAALPAQKCILTTWMHYDSFVHQHHVRLFTRDFYRLFASYLAAARIGGQNMILVPLFTPAFDTQIGGERETAQLLDIREPEPGHFTFDFARLSHFIDFVRDAGMRYLEMPPLFTQWGAKHAPKILVRDARGRLVRRFGWKTDALSDEYRSFLTELLTALIAFLREKGVEEDTFFHVSDEPSLEQYDQYMACKNFMLPLIGRARTLDACSHLEFAGKTPREYSVCIVSTVDNYVRAGVRPLCTYYCCGPNNGHYTNRFLSMPLPRVSVLGLQLYAHDMDLFLHWGFNFYNSYLSRRPIVPYNNTDADGVFTAGDAFIVYPDYAGFGANPSLRLYAMGEGMRLSRALYLYEGLVGRDAALAFLSEEGVTGFQTYPTSDGWLDRLTDRLCRVILAHLPR